MRLQRISGFSVFLLIPLLGGNHLTLFHLTIDRFWIETSFILLLLAAIVILCYQTKRITNSFYRFLIFFCPLLGAAFLSLLYTWSVFSTLNEINTLVWALGATFLFTLSSNRDDLLKGLVVGTTLSSLFAVWQLLVLFPSLLEVYRSGGYAAMLKDQHVPFSSFLNQNMLGGYCASILPLAFYYAFIRRQRVYFAAVSIIALGLILSLSRLAVLACIPSCATVAVLVTKDRGFRGILPVAACIGSAIVIASLIIYGPHRPNGEIQNTLAGKIQRSYREASTLNFRTDIWKTAIKAFKESPVVGYGAGSFVYPYQKHYEGRQYTKVAHGTLFKIAVELGMIGLLTFFWYCFGILRNVRNYRRDLGTLVVGLSALVVLLFGLFDFSFDTAAHVVTFFCLSSVCLLSQSSVALTPKAKMASLLLVLPILLSFVFTAKADSSRRFVEDAKIQREEGSAQEMQQSLIQAVEVMPWNNDASIHLISLLASSYLSEKDPLRREGLRVQLIDHIQSAERSGDKDAELFFVVGSARRAIGDDVGSCDYINQALQYQPSSAWYAYSAAACYVGRGQAEKALSILKSMEVYYDNYQKWRYPEGVMVHKIVDLEAEIEFIKGDEEQALTLMRRNLESARQDQFVINDWRARQSLSKGALIAQLEQRIRSLEAKVAHHKRKMARDE